MAHVFAALLFMPAGRLNWTLGWAYVGIMVMPVCVHWQVAAATTDSARLTDSRRFT